MTDVLTEAGPEQPAGTPTARLAETGRFLTFGLGGETYALDILDVTEIIEYRTVTAVPMMPSFIRGVINLRGRVLPVVDLIARFGQGSTEVARRTAIVVVQSGGHDGGPEGGRLQASAGIGIIVDSVNKVVHLGESDIEPPPAFGGGIRADFIAGMAKYDDQFVVILDISKVLSSEELAALSAGSTDPLQQRVAETAGGEAGAPGGDGGDG